MKVVWLDTIDSTNAVVLRRVAELDNMSVIAAREQTAGRGQRGNTWTSAPGENLTFTVLLKGDFTSEDLVRLNMAAAVAVRNFLRAEGADAVIKWPNDIYVGKRKICGMLIENRLGPSGSTVSAVGIGINLNQTEFPPDLPNPTSLRLQTGLRYDPESALQAFLAFFYKYLPLLYPGGSICRTTGQEDPLFARYAEGLFQAGIPCPYRDLRTGEVFRGIISGVSSDDGRLLVERSVANDPGSTVTPYGFKEIGYIL